MILHQLMLILALLFVACDDASFTGSGSPRPPQSANESELPPEYVPEDPINDADATIVDPSQGCLDKTEQYSEMIDFEFDPYRPTDSLRNVFINTQYVTSHGVFFAVPGNHEPVVRYTVEQNGVNLPNDEEAWMCILCKGVPARNRVIDTQAAQRIGRYVLSSTAAADHVEGSLQISYIYPVSSLSFDLIDVDGDESWLVQAFDKDANDIPGLSVTVSASGYDLDRTGNGAPTKVELKSAGGARSIWGFSIKGAKAGSYRFGFAFDNFRTGVPVCP